MHRSRVVVFVLGVFSVHCAVDTTGQKSVQPVAAVPKVSSKRPVTPPDTAKPPQQSPVKPLAKPPESVKTADKSESVPPAVVNDNRNTSPAAEVPKQPAAEEAAVDPAVQKAIQDALGSCVRKVPYKKFVTVVYDHLGGSPLFLDGLKLNEQGEKLIALLSDVESHGMDSSPYQSLQNEVKTPKDAACLDAQLVSGMTRYLLDFSFYVSVHPQRAMRKPKEKLEQSRDSLTKRLIQLFPEVTENLQALWPRHPEYPALRKALVRYSTLSKQRFPVIKRRLKLGAQGTAVKRLQERLAGQGYYDAEIDGQFNDRVELAVKAFQETHQVDVTGVLDKSTLTALNVPMRYRLKQIRLSLQRWRESHALRSGQPDFIRVNIPAFLLEVYTDNKVTRTHRAIVGSNTIDYDPVKWRQGFLNRTRLFQTVMHEMQLNPVWIVPARIQKREYEPNAKDAGYYRRKGMRQRTTSKGRNVLVQSSGRHNALGLVKLMLRRTNGVYLHDTNRRGLFKYTRRAFSHGCIRVEKALELARFLSSRRGGVDGEKFDELLASGKPTSVKLAQPFPVFADYNTIRLDEKNRLVFLRDVYRWDRSAWRKKVPAGGTTRYGSRVLKPRGVPYIPKEDYRKLRQAGGLAPSVWPPAESVTTKIEGESAL